MTVAAVPGTIGAVMAPLASGDASLGLAAAAGATGFVQTANGPVPVVASINVCLTQLAAALVRVKAFSANDDQAIKQSRLVLAKPFDELGSALADLLLPDPSGPAQDENGNTDYGRYISDVGKDIVDALRNPFVSIINQQSAVLESSFDQIQQVLFSDGNGNQDAVGYFNQAKTAVKTLFLSPTNTQGNLAGIFIYAFEHGIPAIEAELAYLKAMKSTYIGIIEESSKLPARLDIKIANNGVIARLCDAENSLSVVSSRLRVETKFDRTFFNRATDDVCVATSLIFDGKFDSNLLKSHTADFLGVEGIKAKDLAALRFLPGIAYKLKLQALVTLSNLYAIQEQQTTELYKNIIDAEAAIKLLVSFSSSDIIAILVDVLHRQIKALRLGLQTQGGGQDPTVLDAATQVNLNSTITRNGLQPVDSVPLTEDAYKGYTPYADPASQLNTDVSTYISSQAAAYLTLTNLCSLMNKAQMLYKGIDSVLNFESALMKKLLAMIQLFSIERCGDPTTGIQVEYAVTNFLAASAQRLNNTGNGHCPSNAALQVTGEELNNAIKRREQFLNCMLDALSLGVAEIRQALALVSGGYALFTNIRQMARNYPELEKELRALNLRNMLGLDGREYSALESLLQAVQCLLLNCNNPLVQSIGKNTLETFKPQLDRRSTGAVNMSSFDQIPMTASTARTNNRLNQISRVAAAITAVLNLDVNKLCAIDTPKSQAEQNKQRTEASGASFGSTPTTAVKPDPLLPNPEAAAATRAFAKSTVVNGPIYNAPTQANPPPFAAGTGTSSMA